MFFYKRLDHIDHVTFTVDISPATKLRMASKVIALAQSQGARIPLAPNCRLQTPLCFCNATGSSSAPPSFLILRINVYDTR